MNDNGKIPEDEGLNSKPQDATPEQLRLLKAEKFNTDPDKFVDLDDVLLMFIRAPQGTMIFIGNVSIKDVVMLKGDVGYQLDNARRHLEMKMATAQQKENNIITSKNQGVFRKFTRGGKN